MKYLPSISVIVVALFCFTLTGCMTQTGVKQSEQFIETTYKILEASSIVYSNAMESASVLYREGKINEFQKHDILAIGTKFWSAYHAATDALIVYRKVQDAEGMAKINVALTEVSKVSGELLGYVNTFLNKEEVPK